MVAINKTNSLKKRKVKPNHLESLIQTLNNLNVNQDKSGDNDTMDIDTSNIICIDASFQHLMFDAIRKNDVTEVSNLLKEHEGELMPHFDISFFHNIGKHSKGILYSMLRNTDIFENNLLNPFCFDAMIEGIGRTDNYELLKHMTNTHQLTLISKEKIGLYLHCFIDARAYKCLEVLVRFISSTNNKGSHIILKELLTMSLERLDNRIMTIVLKSMKPIL